MVYGCCHRRWGLSLSPRGALVSHEPGFGILPALRHLPGDGPRLGSRTAHSDCGGSRVGRRHASLDARGRRHSVFLAPLGAARPAYFSYEEMSAIMSP